MDQGRAFQTAAIGYMLIFVLAIFANFFVFEAVYVHGDVETTAENIANNGMYRAGALAFLAIAVIDIVVAWALYYAFKKRSQHLSSLAAVFRIANAMLLAAATVFFVLAIKDAAMLEVFYIMWMSALFIFGFHLILLAKLLWKHSRVQSVLAAFLFIAGIGYILDTTALFLLPAYETVAGTALILVATVGVIGELGFTIWVCLRGFRS